MKVEGWAVGNEKVGGMRLTELWLEFGWSLAESWPGGRKKAEGG